MKDCPHCGEHVRRQQPDTIEYGIPAVDGRRYPDSCPHCGKELD